MSWTAKCAGRRPRRQTDFPPVDGLPPAKPPGAGQATSATGIFSVPRSARPAKISPSCPTAPSFSISTALSSTILPPFTAATPTRCDSSACPNRPWPRCRPRWAAGWRWRLSAWSGGNAPRRPWPSTGRIGMPRCSTTCSCCRARRNCSAFSSSAGSAPPCSPTNTARPPASPARTSASPACSMAIWRDRHAVAQARPAVRPPCAGRAGGRGRHHAAGRRLAL